MKPGLQYFFSMALGLLVFSAHAQTALDDQIMSKANNAIATHNCDDAISFLKLVSDSGKAQPLYSLAMAKANDCKSNIEVAISYYNKYLVTNPANDSVKKRIVELQNLKSKKEKVTSQEQSVNILYRDAQNGKFESKKSKYCLKGFDFAWGLTTDLFTGRADAPYKNSIGIFNSYHKPFARHKLLFEWCIDIEYMTNAQKSWFAQIYNTDVSNVVSVPGTVTVGMEFSLAYVILDNKKIALSVGPALGFGAFLMPTPNLLDQGNDVSNPIIIGLTSALKSDLFIRKHFYVSLEYLFFSKSSYSNTLDQGTETTTPLNGNSLRLSFGVRGFGIPRGYYYHYR